MITLNAYRINSQMNDITVFFTLTDGENTYKWHGDVPIMPAEELQKYIESKEEEYLCGIYRKRFKEAVIVPTEKQTLLEAWREWEQAGCLKTDVLIDEKTNEFPTEKVIVEAVPWRDTHPEKKEVIVSVGELITKEVS